METKFLKYVHRLHKNDGNDKSKYILENSNWNDYGYYTRYGLYLPIKDNARLTLAGLFIIKYKLDIDEIHWSAKSVEISPLLYAILRVHIICFYSSRP